MKELVQATNVENVTLETLSLLCGAKLIEEAPTVGGWISVKERLPENGQQVVAISVDGVCEVVNFEERTGRWLGMEGWYPTDRIAHWMPLPKLPKEEDNDAAD